MTIDPILQLGLFLASLLGGISLGLLADLGKVVKILLGAHQPPKHLRALYERPLPLLGKPLGWHTAPPRRIWCRAVSLFAELLFPIIGALVFLWIGFRFHGGLFRISALALFVIGVALWRLLCTPRLDPLIAYAAFLLAVGLLYLRVVLILPLRLFLSVLLRFLLLPAVRLWRVALAKRRKCRSLLLCKKQLSAAQNGFLATTPSVSAVKAELYKGKKKVCRKKEKRVAELRH